ncbi:IS1 family transposase [Escherichia coli]
MMVVILTPVDGIIRWLPRGFSCSPVELHDKVIGHYLNIKHYQ